MKIIRIIDNNCDRYTINTDCLCLGRQWDNYSEQIKVVRPERELENTCTMIVSADGLVIDHLDIKNEPKDITNVLSRYPKVEISFTFTGINGYVKNSEIKEFYFAEARKPEEFNPVEPEQSSKLDIVLGSSFIDVVVDNDILKFYNANNNVVKEIPLPKVDNYNLLAGKPSINGVVLEGNKTTSELGIVTEESDPTVPSYVKNITESDIQSWNSKIGESNLVRSFDIESEYTPESNYIYNAYAINELMMIFGSEIENDRSAIEQKIDKSDIINVFDVMENEFPQDTTKIYNVYAVNELARLFGQEIANSNSRISEIEDTGATQQDLQNAVGLAETYINEKVDKINAELDKKPDTEGVTEALMGVVEIINTKADKTELDKYVKKTDITLTLLDDGTYSLNINTGV